MSGQHNLQISVFEAFNGGYHDYRRKLMLVEEVHVLWNWDYNLNFSD